MKHLESYNGFIKSFYDKTREVYNDIDLKKKEVKYVHDKEVLRLKNKLNSETRELDDAYNNVLINNIRELGSNFNEIFFTLIEDYGLESVPFVNNKVIQAPNTMPRETTGFQFKNDEGQSSVEITTELIAELKRANGKLRAMNIKIDRFSLSGTPSHCYLENIEDCIGHKVFAFTMVDTI
jgi:hypothetical protein